MRFVCESCRRQYEIKEEKVGAKGVKVKCRNCGFVIHVKRSQAKAVAESLLDSQDDSAQTQVIESPFVAAAPGGSKSASAKKKAKTDESFLGADEDEIGAVFDQVLQGGSTSSETSGSASGNVPALFEEEDDQLSTRVIQADVVRQLVAASETGPAGATAQPATEAAAESVPTTDWYVAIGEKQVGPVTLDKVKSYWDSGELGPDSLCWRNGYSDWVPLSQVKTLAAVLAPKPARPIVVAAQSPAGAVVSMPVQSAFSSGGMVQTVQSEVQVAMPGSLGTASREDANGWKPSAASALASLVKDEMAALSKPAVAAAPIDFGGSKGLLDVPMEANEAPVAEVAKPRTRTAVMPAAVANPYAASTGGTFSAAPVTSYRPPPNRGLWAIVAGGLAVVAALVFLVVWVVSRPPQVVLAPAPAVAAAPVVAAPVAQPAPVAAAAPPAAATPVAVAPAAAAAPTPGAVEAPKPKTTGQPKPVAVAAVRPNVPREAKEPAAAPPQPEKKEAPVDSDDEFAKAFGGGSKKSEAKDTGAAAASKPKSVYIPPAPGGGGSLKEVISQSDVYEVLKENQSALKKCTDEQHKKEPNVKGAVTMRFTILPSGKVSQVTCTTDEFKQSSMATCISSTLKGLTFARAKSQADPFVFPFRF